MIPTIVPIVEDETFLSWLNHLSSLNGFDIGSFTNLLFGYRRNRKIAEIVNLDEICRRENRSSFFPDVRKIICRHTSAFADQIYYSYAWQAKGVVHMTRSHEGSALCGIEKLTKGKAGTIKTCPLCEKEDMEKYGRIVIHTPHQARGVEACYKHGVLLRREGTESVMEATAAQNETALFSYGIYESSLFTDYSGVCRCIGSAGGRNTEMINDAVGKGYISEGVNAGNLKNALTNGNYKKSPKSLVGYLTYLFRDFDTFRSMIPMDGRSGLQDAFMNAIAGQYRLEGDFDMVVRLTCLRCGNMFHTHPEAVLRSVGCPVCDITAGRRGLIGRYAKRIEKEYEVIPSKAEPVSGVTVIHRPCGHASEISIRKLVWDRPAKCRHCNPHLGEEAVAENGMRMTVIAYRLHNDIDVEFEDGTIVRKKRYSDFKKGHIPYPRIDARTERHRKKRVGQKFRATNGMMMTITDYRKSYDVDVLFEDGTPVAGLSYSCIKKGTVRHPTRSINDNLREGRIGETVLTKTGRLITLVAYRSAASVDVRFEDGTVKTTSYLRFKNGQVQHPDDKTHNDRVGEEYRANNGMKMTIIDYRSSSYVTVRFEDGEVRKGVSYRDIRNGAVTHPKDKRKRRVHTDRIGETNMANCGMLMTIIAYRTCNDLDVRFEDGVVVVGKSYQNFKTGEIRHP